MNRRPGRLFILPEAANCLISNHRSVITATVGIGSDKAPLYLGTYSAHVCGLVAPHSPYGVVPTLFLAYEVVDVLRNQWPS
jgi:hypothetical protein